MRQRLRRVLPGVWAGLLLGIALVAAPAAFSVLPGADAGRIVSRLFIREAWLSLAVAAALLMLERGRADHSTPREGAARFGNVRLLWATMVCTLLGYFGVQALLPAARAGQGMFSFAQLHGFSVVCYALKTLLVLLLAWRATRESGDVSRPLAS
jgi:Domain of unknown function (DUF4149)